MRAGDPIRPPELSELETFVLAVNEGSIAAAASKLLISAPAAAKRIRQLEALAQTPLLSRERRGVRPTVAGARLYPIARDVIAQRARAVEALTSRSETDPLRIAGMRRVLGDLDAPAAQDLVGRSEALLAALFHASSESILITQADDGLVCEINDAAVRLTGYQQAEVRGRCVTELNLWADIETRNDLVERALATREPQEGELVILTKARRRRRVRGRFQTIELHTTVYLLLLLLEIRTSSHRAGDHRYLGGSDRA